MNQQISFLVKIHYSFSQILNLVLFISITILKVFIHRLFKLPISPKLVKAKNLVRDAWGVGEKT